MTACRGLKVTQAPPAGEGAMDRCPAVEQFRAMLGGRLSEEVRGPLVRHVAE